MKKIRKIYEQLLSYYGEQGWWPILINQNDINKFQEKKYKTKFHKIINSQYYSVYSTEFKNREKTENEKLEIMIGVILTQSVNWKNVELALAKLKEKNCLNIDCLKEITLTELSELIKSSGYKNQKAKKIKELIQYLNRKKWLTHNSITRQELLNIWGIGNESADSILLYAFDKSFFVVDAYTKRLFNRLGIIQSVDYMQIQNFIQNNIEKNYKIYNEFHALIVEHSKTLCQSKPKCDICPLKEICKTYDTKSKI